MQQNQNIQPADDEEDASKSNQPPGRDPVEDVTPVITDVTSKQSTDNNPTQPAQNSTMEVHHHGHVHHRTKWKEYIFQFFMLFLAVFCGFLAEYQLEHKIEKDRAIEFAGSLITDLEKDTASINDHIRFRDGIAKNADSLMQMIKYSSINEQPDQAFFHFSSVSGLAIMRTYKGTIDQLKASGALRYFKNRQLTTALIDYYNQLAEVEHRIQFIFDFNSQWLTPFFLAHVDARYMDDPFRREKNIAPFRNMGEEENIRLYNIISRLKGTNNSLAAFVLPAALKEAEELIAMIKKEYHL